MWNRRKCEAKGPAPDASGDTSKQSEKPNAENSRKRKSRRPPSTPTGSDHESAGNDDVDPSSFEANQVSVDDGPQDSSASTEKTEEQEKPTRPMRCDNYKGPHRKRVCPHLPCDYCKEEGHTSGACPKRLLKQQKTRSANIRMWRKSEASEKGKTCGDDNKGVVIVIMINRIRHSCGVAFAEDLIRSQRARNFHVCIVWNEGICGMTAPSDWQKEDRDASRKIQKKPKRD